MAADKQQKLVNQPNCKPKLSTTSSNFVNNKIFNDSRSIMHESNSTYSQYRRVFATF